MYHCVIAFVLLCYYLHVPINQPETDLAELLCGAINHVLLQLEAVRSVAEVIKTCRDAFMDPENLDEFVMMDKLAGLLARVENTKVCMSN